MASKRFSPQDVLEMLSDDECVYPGSDEEFDSYDYYR